MISDSNSTEQGTALFVNSQRRVRWDNYLTAALDQSARRVPRHHVCPTIDTTSFQDDLERFDFETPRDYDELFPWVIQHLEDGIVHPTHPRYFGLFNPAPSFPAECADRIAAAFNPQLATSTTSPVPIAIEAHVIRAIAARAGFPAGTTGHFTTGGSEANFTALTCALTVKASGYAMVGARALPGKPAVYVSEDAHLAWVKIAHQAGIGRAAIRLVATDHLGCMNPTALQDAIAVDTVAGACPVMIVATAGTTGAGMIDPLADCRRIARMWQAWLHIDAAWGGALIVSDRLRGLLRGIEAADSATIDAHKWLATTMGCGMFLTPHAKVLSECFNVATSYMPSNVRHLDPYVLTGQWSRRFLGLRLFLSLAAAGWRGYAAYVERAVELAEQLKRDLRNAGWTIANQSPLAVVCAEPPAGFKDPRTIAREVVASGKAWVSTTLFGGRHVLRMCITNGRTSADDLRELVSILHEVGKTQTVGKRANANYQTTTTNNSSGEDLNKI